MAQQEPLSVPRELEQAIEQLKCHSHISEVVRGVSVNCLHLHRSGTVVFERENPYGIRASAYTENRVLTLYLHVEHSHREEIKRFLSTLTHV